MPKGLERIRITISNLDGTARETIEKDMDLTEYLRLLKLVNDLATKGLPKKRKGKKRGWPKGKKCGPKIQKPSAE